MPQNSPRPRSRRGGGEQLRAEILAAVDRLLGTWDSEEKLTMRAVAQEVGVAAPSIYLHFSDKSELVWAALADKYAQLAELMHSAQAALPDSDPRGQLRAQVHAYCAFAVQNPGHYRLMYQVRQPATARDRLSQHPARQVSGLLRHTLLRCAESGHALALPLHQCAHTLWTGLHGMVSIQHTMAASGSIADLQALADGLVDVLVCDEITDDTTLPEQSEVDQVIAAAVGDAPAGTR